MKKTIARQSVLIALLLCILLQSAQPAVSAANGFRYQHDPQENAAAMRDIVADETAIYGFRPTETGSLKMYADADWSDPALVEQGRQDRIAYHKSIASMYDLLQQMQAEGRSAEEIARAVSARRNEIRLEAYADDPEGLAALKARNLEKYGHEEGPLPEELFAQYGSWERVTEKAFSPNSGMDACLGLYDDYYFLYVALGDAPADMTVTLPASLFCGYQMRMTLTPQIETDAQSYTVSFVSEDPATASVDEAGVVTGVSCGETAVRCVVTDAGGFEHCSAPCQITVRASALQWLLFALRCLLRQVMAVLSF